jgi:hypothetical protein|uniref:Uncharacterized protein n=1 Tax=Siphoviridae sp. ctrCN24 TaxID=2827953 RepID=A0A8S5SKH9_9CAUD|nr:MAG TPA: hypothetical protein [Siphoviridae sp. ctrCN24]
MDAIEFIEERCRMCNFYYDCNACPGKEDTEFCVFNVGSGVSAKEQVAIVEKWSAEHPRKTRQSVFLEQYPNSLIDDEGILKINPCHINKNFNRFFSKDYCEISCTICRRDYWSKEVE